MDFQIVRRSVSRSLGADIQREAFKRDVPDFFETLLASSFREFVSETRAKGTRLTAERGDDRGYQHHHLSSKSHDGR